MMKDVFCAGCDAVLASDVVDANNIAPCKRCGCTETIIRAKMDELIGSSDGDRDLTETDSAGRVTSERISRASRSISSDTVTDSGKPSRIRARRTYASDGFSDEGDSAKALAKAYNAKYGTSFAVAEKKVEDSDYADRILKEGSNTMPIQITQLDTEMIGALGRTGKFSGEREASDLVQKINKSIERKSQIDRGLRSATVLVLQIPAPLGSMVRSRLEETGFDHQGFRGIWVHTLGEDCFEI